MSYEIVYGKQFVKLRKTGEVIPMLLAGSNNCFEVGIGGRNGRRSRDWANQRFYLRKGKISDKPEAIMAKVDAELSRRIRDRYDKTDKPAGIRARFGYYAGIAVGGGHCSDTSWDKYRGVYANGIKNALTIEELDKLGVNLYFFDVGLSLGDRLPDTPASVTIKTERQFFEELRKWRGWQNGNGKGFWLGFSPRSTDMVLERLRAPKRKPATEKVRVDQDHYFVLTDGYNGLVKYTSRGYKYSSRSGGKRFRTEKDAEKYRQQLLKNNRYKADVWRVERIDCPTSFRV